MRASIVVVTAFAALGLAACQSKSDRIAKATADALAADVIAPVPGDQAAAKPAARPGDTAS